MADYSQWLGGKGFAYLIPELPVAYGLSGIFVSQHQGLWLADRSVQLIDCYICLCFYVLVGRSPDSKSQILPSTCFFEEFVVVCCHDDPEQLNRLKVCLCWANRHEISGSYRKNIQQCVADLPL